MAASLWERKGSETGDITDPEIGELKFYYKTWATGYSLNFTELKTKVCEKKDFHKINGTISDESAFYLPQERKQRDLDKYGVGKMRCLDES